MEILLYGEDGLTLWAMENRLPGILEELYDDTPPSDCTVLYRPSFGRSGGENSPQFGEFDFIIISKKRIYLGESKWIRKPGNRKRVIELGEAQVLRHRVLRCYIDAWYNTDREDWSEFLINARHSMDADGIRKPVVTIGITDLERNLRQFLNILNMQCKLKPEIIDILLLFRDGGSDSNFSARPESFRLLQRHCDARRSDNFIHIDRHE